MELVELGFPAEEADAERGDDEAYPERREDAERSLPEITTGSVPFGTAGDEESTDGEEAVDGDRSYGRLGSDPVAAESSEVDGVRCDDGYGEYQPEDVEAVGLGIK